MNKIIPFNKDIRFDEKIGEIQSIALDDTLKFTDAYTIKGDLIVRGCYKNADDIKDFSYPLPVFVTVDSKYDTEHASIVIDDFYYEIINDNILRVKIDLMLDDLYFKEENRNIENELIKEEIKDTELIPNVKEKIKDTELIPNVKEEIKADSDEQNETYNKDYSLYRVYVIKDDDTLESIVNKYKITKEDLEEINDLSILKPGTKLIIPSINE